MQYETRYERCDSGITCRGIRRAFRDELNARSAFATRLQKAAGHFEVASFEGAFMTNQGTDLRMIIVTADGREDIIRLDVQIDSGSKKEGAIRMNRAPKVRTRHRGDYRRLCIAPRIWFYDTTNALGAENKVTFEELLKSASPEFAGALEAGVDRAQTTFEARMKPKSRVPFWMFTR